jgi:hypothetical protein
MRRHISYANVAATLALVFSMSGGALAAKHYLISSTKQISPKVLKALKGRPGHTGPQGTPGSPGKDGIAGKEGQRGATGEPGPLPTTLPSGKTEVGSFAGVDYRHENATISPVALATISYPVPVASSPSIEVVQAGGPSTANCPGTTEAPSAARGWLCVYVYLAFNVGSVSVEPITTQSKFGAVPFAEVSVNKSTGQFWGTWAVTAA